jgi:saccharopine dehydrogenase (NAD+, L-lysine-forming)
MRLYIKIPDLEFKKVFFERILRKIMSKVVVLGGCGVVGSVAAKTLVHADEFSEVVIADINLDKAKQLATEFGSKASAIKFDALDLASIKNAIKGANVVVNCVGPFYKFAIPILNAVIESKVNYVDVCDDVEPTYAMLAMDEKVKQANICALIGMGSSPGVTNLLAKYAATDLLVECDSIDMYHAHGGEPSEGPGVIGHRFYCMTIDVPVFNEGKAITVKTHESESLQEEISFINLPGKYRVFPYPHPEPITLPKYIKGIKRVTNKGTVLPEEYYNLTLAVHTAGLDSKDEIDVKGLKITPYEFAIAYLIKRRDEILKKINFGEQKGCVKIVVKGRKKEKKQLVDRTYVFSLVSEGTAKNQAMGEATGIPAAFGAILMNQGKITVKGVCPPEACIDPMDFLELMRKTLSLEKASSGKSPLIIESIDGEGNVKRLEI